MYAQQQARAPWFGDLGVEGHVNYRLNSLKGVLYRVYNIGLRVRVRGLGSKFLKEGLYRD